MSKNNLEVGKGLFQLITCSPSVRKVKAGTWRRELQQKPGGNAAYRLAPMVAQFAFLYNSELLAQRWHYLQWAGSSSCTNS